MPDDDVTPPVDGDDKPADGNDEKIIYNKNDGDDKKPDDQKTDPPPDDSGKTEPADDGKKTDDAKGNEVFNAKDLKVPSDISESHVKRIAEFAEKHELKTETAQAILDNQAELRKSVLSEAESAHEANVKTWVSDVKTDSEIGGTKYKESVQLAQQAVRKFGSDKLIEIFNDTGYGNHPEIVRAFARIGKAMSNDSLIKGSPLKEEKKLEDILYN